MPARLRALIPAAGRGSRAGLPYPKTLHPVRGTPILGRLLDLLAPYDAEPVVVVSPEGQAPVAAFLAETGRHAELVVQPEPRGMGDAVLRFEDAAAAHEAEDVLLVWGDIPLLSPDTLAATVEAHRAGGAAMTFPTRHVERAYTIVQRDPAGRVTALIETREAGIEPGPGERDIGLFVCRRAAVFPLLAQRFADGIGARTGEHGFLHIVGHLARGGLRVEALPIATPDDLVSLNALADLEGVA